MARFTGSEVTVVFGTVAGLTPTIGGTGIDSEEPPSLSVNSEGTIYAKVTYDYATSLVSKAEIIFSRTAKANTTTEAYQPIANVLSADGVFSIQQVVTGSLGFYVAFGQAVFVGL